MPGPSPRKKHEDAWWWADKNSLHPSHYSCDSEDYSSTHQRKRGRFPSGLFGCLLILGPPIQGQPYDFPEF